MTATYDLFQHDWRVSTRVESAWRTLVTEADATLAEERTQLWDRPLRTVTVEWTGVKRAEAHRILMHLMRNGVNQIRVPLYCDQAITTAASSGGTINCPTAYRRFQVGQLVAIHEVGNGGRATNVQYRTISAVAADSITVSVALTGTYPTGSRVYPVIVAEVALEQQVSFPTDQVCSVAASFVEVLGATALAALRDGADYPDAYSTAVVDGGDTDHPIFNPPHNWSNAFEAGMLRPGEVFEQGNGRVVHARGTRPLMRWSVSLLFGSRAEAWDFLGFFDAARGRTGVFWFPFPADPWLSKTYATGYVEIEPDGNIEDLQELISHFAVVYTNGTVAVRAIDSVALQGGNWRITPTEALPAGTLDGVSRIVPCILARFEQDAIVEEWVTEEVMRTSFSVREVVAEADVLSVSEEVACE